MTKFKIGDIVHIVGNHDAWEDICCGIIKLEGHGYIVSNGRGDPDRFFPEEALEHVSNFVFKYTLKKLEEEPQLRQKLIFIER